MKKVIFYSLILSLTFSMIQADNKDINKTQEKPKTMKIDKKTFKNLLTKQGVFKKQKVELDETRRLLKESNDNYDSVLRSANKIQDIQRLIKNISNNEECCIAYFRLKELDTIVKNSKNEKEKEIIQTKIINPLNTYLSKCKNLELELLKKYDKK